VNVRRDDLAQLATGEQIPLAPIDQAKHNSS
jgi:hypothetical protein